MNITFLILLICFVTGCIVFEVVTLVRKIIEKIRFHKEKKLKEKKAR